MNTIKLINNDCLSTETLDQIEDDSIDIVFTSPPYNIGGTFSDWKDSKTRQTGAKYKNDPSTDSKTNWTDWIYNFVIKYLEKSKYIFLNLQSLSSNKKQIHELLYKLNDYYCDKIIWNKEMGIPHGANSRVMTATFEEIFIFSKNPTKRVGTKEWFGNVNNLFTMKGNRHNEYAKLHKAMFPVELPKYIFENFVKEGGIVCDPFMGLGSSGIAAQQLNLNFIGIEIDDEYFDIATQRIKLSKKD